MKRSIVLPLLIAVLAFVPMVSQAGEGFFHTEKIQDRWWFVAPGGQPFISKGVTTILFDQDKNRNTNVSPYGETVKAKYGSEDAWRVATAKRLTDWGFNSLGSWSDEKVSSALKDGRRLAYAPILDIGAGFVAKNGKGTAWLKGIFPDVFDPDFETFAYERAAKAVQGRIDDHWLLGWFIDNELRWKADWRGHEELVTMFLALPAGAPGRKAAIDVLHERYGDVAKFNDVWGTSFKSWDELDGAGEIKQPVMDKSVHVQNQESGDKNGADSKAKAFMADRDAFLGKLAERYFRITSEALKRADPNHMNFGCRFAYVPPAPVIAAAAKYVDVISFNCYATDPRPVIQSYAVFGKPLIIGEFAFRGEDSGLPNTKGAGPKVKTQAGRAAAFENYITLGLQNPFLVGYHWFEHADEPKEGRFDGENSNYGVVNIHDEPYEELTLAMTRVNLNAEKLHTGQGN